MKFISLLLLLLNFSAASAGLSEQQQSNLQKLVEEYHHLELANGAVIVGVIDHGERYFFSSDGSINKKTIFEIGSISKTFTGLLLALAQENKKLTLDTTLAQVFPKVKMPKQVAAITMKQLATHSSGLPRLPDNFDPTAADPYAKYSLAMLRNYLSTAKLINPGKFAYSNIGLGILGQALALQLDASYDQLIQSSISAPLALVDTQAMLSKLQQKRFVKGFDFAGTPSGQWTFTDTMAGAGALRSTADDMLTYLAAQLAVVDNVDAASGLNAKLRQAMFETQKQHLKRAGENMGLGWLIRGKGNKKVYWHNGGTGGYRSFAAFAPAKKRGVIVLVNSTAAIDELGVAVMQDEANKLLTDLRQRNKTLDAKLIAELSGEYPLSPDFVISIFGDQQKLYAQATNQPRFKLQQLDNDKVYVINEVGAKIEFVTSKEGKVNALILYQGGQEMKASKR